MFKNEYEYLIHLIKCAIHNTQPIEKPNNISFECVFEVGKLHEVANIAFVSVEKLHDKPNDKLYNKWKVQFALSIQRNANQMAARDMIVNALNEQGIRTLELQGTIIKKLYPYAFWRNMSDIDFVVDKENLLKAEVVLQKMGCVTQRHGDYDISAYTKPKIAIELHSDFFDPNTEFYTKITNPFKKAVLSSNCMLYIADETDVFLYNVLHCIKHFRGKGTGIRRLLDIYLLNNDVLPNIDKHAVFEFLTSLDCKCDYDNLSAIAQEWFDKDGAKTNLDHIKSKIYKAGTHGTFDVRMLNEYDKSKIKVGLKFRTIISLIFPAKKNIYDAYEFCAKHKLPIFICWVYRWECLLFVGKKRKHAIEIITKIKRLKIK